MKKSLLIIAIIAIIIGVLYFISKKEVIAPAVVPPVVTDTNLAEEVSVESYLRANISKLSPVKTVLGGTWYVVSDTVDLVKNTGTVVYEDGHIQETKNFSYTTNEKGEIVSLTIIDPINPIACTMEAKLCPDGSYVSRTGPNCEFSLCPPTTTSGKSGITGTVTLGPTCPVERMPPDPNCAPKFYSTSINIMKAGSTKIIKTIQSNSNGVFSADLGVGSYVLQAQGGNVLPRCGGISAEVKSSQYTKVEISGDTGIR